MKKLKNPTDALELLAMGKSHREVTKITGITFDELVGLKNRHAKTLAERKAHLAFDGFEMVGMLFTKAYLLMQEAAEREEES